MSENKNQQEKFDLEMRETQQKMRDLIAKYENEIKNAKDEHVPEIVAVAAEARSLRWRRETHDRNYGQDDECGDGDVAREGSNHVVKPESPGSDGASTRRATAARREVRLPASLPVVRRSQARASRPARARPAYRARRARSRRRR